MPNLSHIFILKLKDQKRIIDNPVSAMYEENSCLMPIIKEVYKNFEKSIFTVSPHEFSEIDYVFELQKKYYKKFEQNQETLNFKITIINDFQYITWDELVLIKDREQKEITDYSEKQDTKLRVNQHWLTKIKNSSDPYLIHGKILTIDSNIINLQINLDKSRFYLIDDLIFVKQVI